MALFLALTLSCTSIHEAGHASAVIWLRASLQVISVWGVGYDFEKRHFGAQRARRGREVGGFVRYISSQKRKLSKGDHVKIAIAGPIANIATMLVAVASTNWIESKTWDGAAIMFAILSGGMAATNMVPFEGSDGFTVQAFLRNRKSRGS